MESSPGSSASGLPSAPARFRKDNLRAVKVGPLSCYCVYKPGQGEGQAGDEVCFGDERRPGLEEGYAPQVDNIFQAALELKKGPLGPGPIPPLTPLGGGGWNLEEDLTSEMLDVRDQALRLFRDERHQDLSVFNRDFLTPLTLSNYVNPCSPEHLKNTLVRRAEKERDLSCENGPGVYLAGSARIVGFDGAGRSIVASEPCTMKRSIGYYLDQVEYVTWTALDLCRPGNTTCNSNGFIELVDFGGGFNFTHFLDPRPCISIAQMLEGQFRRRAQVCIFVEMPSSFETILNTFLQVVKPGTRAKLRYVSSPEEALECFKQMGSSEDTCSRIAAFMAERRNKQVLQTWHPIVDHPFFKERLADLRLTQDTQFFSSAAHKRLREAIQEFRIATWGPPLRPLPEPPCSPQPRSGAGAPATSPGMPRGENRDAVITVSPTTPAAKIAVSGSGTEAPSSPPPENAISSATALTLSRAELRRCMTPCGTVEIVENTSVIQVQKEANGTSAIALSTTREQGCGAGAARLLKQLVLCCSSDSKRAEAPGAYPKV